MYYIHFYSFKHLTRLFMNKEEKNMLKLNWNETSVTRRNRNVVFVFLMSSNAQK